jgi:hypothetical protein
MEPSQDLPINLAAIEDAEDAGLNLKIIEPDQSPRLSAVASRNADIGLRRSKAVSSIKAASLRTPFAAEI